MTNHPATSELRKPNIWPMWVPKTIPPHPKPQGGSHRLTDSPTVGIRLMAQFRASWFFWTLLIGLNWRWKNHQLYLQCFPIAVAVEAAGAKVVSESREFWCGSGSIILTKPSTNIRWATWHALHVPLYSLTLHPPKFPERN